MTKKTKINRSDLTFYPSERLTDNPDGGGQPLGTPIQGRANELFDPISSVARVNGDFNTVLVYAGVRRDDDEPLIGANVAITKPPADDSVSYLLAKAEFGELRKNAIKRIEGYVAPTIESKMTLLSSPTKGSKIIQVYQRQGESLPQIGDNYCLSQEKQGYPALRQFISVVKVEATDRTFNDGQHDFVRTVIKLEISQPLLHDFVGVDYPTQRLADSPTKVRETHVADSASYYGVKPLVQAIKKGSSTLQVSSLTEKIIPTATIETAITDERASRVRPMLVSLGDKEVSVPLTVQFDNAILPIFAPNSFKFGAISDQNGKLLENGQQIGAVDYLTGKASFTKSGQATAHATYRPAIVHYPPSDSVRFDITLANRSYTHIFDLPSPAKGSLAVSYVAGGKWYELFDNGQGKLVGASVKHGSGVMDYATGSLTLTCGELPDVGSSIIVHFALASRVTDLSAQTIKTLALYQPSTPTAELSIRLSDGKAATLTNGKLTGDLTGYSDNGQLYITSSHEPSALVGATFSYRTGTPINSTLDGGRIHYSGVSRGTVKVYVPIIAGNHKTAIYAHDDGNGKLIYDGVQIGTINYATADVSFLPSFTISVGVPTYRTETYKVKEPRLVLGLNQGEHTVTKTREFYDGIVKRSVPASVRAGATVTASFFEAGVGDVKEETLNPKLVLEIGGELPLLAGTVSLRVAGNLAKDDGRGRLMQGSEQIGTVDYQTARVIVNRYGTATLLTAGAMAGQASVDGVSFRTPTAPIRPQSLSVRATTTDGKSIHASANVDGEVVGDEMTGTVDIKTGAVSVDFGKWVNADSVQGESWYSSDKVVDGKVWQPLQVLADSIVFNAVAISHLPLDGNHIKIDTVRLPQDGKVPIFRRGDTILIGNRQTVELGSAFTSGQTINLPRQNLDRICLMDSDDKPVNAELWQYDLDAGTISFATPLDLSGYKLPLKAMHAQEEKNRIIQTDIDGTLSLFFGVRHDYPAENTYVSSVLLHGKDLEVSVSIPFTQRNWNGEWQDEPAGEQLLNRLNITDYPFVLTDDGAITERWLIRFTSSNQFELYGEHLGFVGKFDTLTDLAPINPATQKPYFTLDKRAFGGNQNQVANWAAQDVIRFNTEGTLMPVWILRAVQPSSKKQLDEDGFRLCLFGDTTEVDS